MIHFRTACLAVCELLHSHGFLGGYTLNEFVFASQRRPMGSLPDGIGTATLQDGSLADASATRCAPHKFVKLADQTNKHTVQRLLGTRPEDKGQHNHFIGTCLPVEISHLSRGPDTGCLRQKYTHFK